MVSQFLEHAQFTQANTVAQMQVGRGGVHAQVDAQRCLRLQRREQELVQLTFHGAARLSVAEGGAVQQQAQLPPGFRAHRRGRRGGTGGRLRRHGAWGSASAARAASQSRRIWAVRSSTLENLRSARIRATSSIRRSQP